MNDSTSTRIPTHNFPTHNFLQGSTLLIVYLSVYKSDWTFFSHSLSIFYMIEIVLQYLNY